MRLYNTLTRRKEEFTSQGRVSLYVCGVTPYDTTHIGHARTYLVFDVLIRHLLQQGLKVDYVQNITDVDDSILARAAELGESYIELGDIYTGIYMDDIASLGMIPARAYPRATGAIPEMQEVIRRLLASGHAYRVGGDVYMGVENVRTYGELSRLTRAEMLSLEASQDGSTVSDPRKKDPLDLLLWRSVEDAEPSWESPWGPGRPGWHVECSTLALTHLGKAIDIHGGGSDLVFPHHEAEIAQSEAVTGVRPFVRFWVHVGMVRFHGEKMSKSRQNMLFVRDHLRHYSADALRLYLLLAPYREPLDFDEDALRAASTVAHELSQAARAPIARGGASIEPGPHEKEFDRALDDDLDVGRAIEPLRALASEVSGGGAAYGARRALRRLASRLGLDLEP